MAYSDSLRAREFRFHERAVIRDRPDLPATGGAGNRNTSGGARRDRTDDLLLAKQALSQLSYGPKELRPAAAKVGGPGKI